MRKAWIVSALASLLPLFLAACINSGDQPPEHVLPDPAELIAERRMETIRAHRMLIVGIAPSPVAEMERKLVAALLDGTGYRFRIIRADRDTLGAFLRAGRTDIICGLFTEQELKDAHLAFRTGNFLSAPIADKTPQTPGSAGNHLPGDGASTRKTGGISFLRLHPAAESLRTCSREGQSQGGGRTAFLRAAKTGFRACISADGTSGKTLCGRNTGKADTHRPFPAGNKK